MLPWIRQWFYELFLTSHLILSVFVVIAIWLHLRRRLGFDGICLVISFGLFVLNSIIYMLRQIFRNIVIGQPLAIADLIKHKDAVEITFRPPRPWKVHAGQYVYVRAPGVRPFSFAESHPYSIIWWESGPDEKAVSISVLAKVESGFTRALYVSPHTRLRVLIDGPYGEHKDTEAYDSILMIAAGIGIAAQLSYVKELVGRLRTQSHMTNTGVHTHHKRISLVWQLEEECKASYLYPNRTI
jgi:2-polyprenylphenol hydroxylase and related flavodoxin oxidoreductases